MEEEIYSMVQLGGMQGIIASFLASPQGKEMIYGFLNSPEGQKAIDRYLSTAEGNEMACLILSRALNGLNLPERLKEEIRIALREKKT